MILETKVLPIEYNEKSQTKAQRLKRFLEQNPAFFKTFLKGNIISYIDENSPLYLGKHQSILEYIDSVHPRDCLYFIYNKFFPSEPERLATLFILTNKKVNGEYQFSEEDIENANIGALYAYCFDQKDYDKLKENMANQDEILSWFYEKYRFQLFNYILDFSINYLKDYYEYESTLEDFIQEMVKTTAIETMELSDSKYHQEIEYPMDKETSLQLVEDFLITINPTWQKKLKKVVEENLIIEDYQDNRIKGLITKDDSCQCILGKDEKWYIYMPRKNTLEDAINLLHEVIHYIVETQEKDKTVNSLKEFPSLFFEQVFCTYLIQRGYPKEEVDKYTENRKYYTEENCMDIIDYLLYIQERLEKETITEEDMLAMELGEEEDSREEIERILKEKIDTYIEEDLVNPQIYMKMYTYIEGKRYADIMFKRLQEGQDVLPDMIEITSNQKSLRTPNILSYLNLTPPTKEETLEKLLTKKRAI